MPRLVLESRQSRSGQEGEKGEEAIEVEPQDLEDKEDKEARKGKKSPQLQELPSKTSGQGEEKKVDVHGRIQKKEETGEEDVKCLTRTRGWRIEDLDREDDELV